MREAHVRFAGLGAVVGDVAYYERICYQPPEQLRDKESWRVLFARRDGEDVGFAVFRRSHKWEKYRPAGELAVWLLVGDPVAQLVLLRRLVDFDLMGSVSIGKVGVDDPLVLWAGGPRSTSDVGTYDSLWVRLVDLPEALQARTWTQPCDVTVEVEDANAPWNQGRWRIHADATGQASRGTHVRRRRRDAADPGPRRRIPRRWEPRRPAPGRARRRTARGSGPRAVAGDADAGRPDRRHGVLSGPDRHGPATVAA